MDDEGLLRYVDVGALGGLEGPLAARPSELWPILFEPNPVEAQKIRDSMGRYPRHSVIERALGHLDQTSDFVVTRNPTCSSLLQPNFTVLRQYGISYHFAVQETGQVQLSRYDTLFHEGLVPRPDALKIDVQGFEHEVLLGFGSLLADVLAIKLETHFYEVYSGQRLFGDIVQLLAGFGFQLRKIDMNKLGHFAGDLVEADAYFSKGRRTIRDLPAEARRKFDVLAALWELPAYDFDLP